MGVYGTASCSGEKIYMRLSTDDELKALLEEAAHHDHHHHHHDHDEHEHHHDHDHEHDHDHHEHEHHHDHDHEHGEDCTCGCHDHDHDHHHHHADEVFTSWGRETSRSFTAEQIENALKALGDEEKYGMILRAKGIVQGENGEWIHFDYVPGVPEVRTGSASTIGRLCVIGSELNEAAVAELFGEA